MTRDSLTSVQSEALISGVDVSTKGIAYVTLTAASEQLVGYGWLTIAARDEGTKALRCTDLAVGRLAALMADSDLVVIEQPFGRQVKSVAEVERVVGAVLATLPVRCARFLLGPSAWKKAAGLAGNVGKPAIGTAACMRWPELRGERQDVYDAALIALAGVRVNATGREAA